MRYLVDTNLFLDIISEDFISKDARAILEDYENVFYISSESIKEFIHLVQKEKISPVKDMEMLHVFDVIEKQMGFKVKFVTKEHLCTMTSLELFKEHNDPSDRLIIAQAITESIPLISSDKVFKKYKSMGLDLILNIEK
jgi:PIN domain nuclease of toxin-antitoxin system